ncbi:MAG: hypothetical protein GWO86_00100 [Planctomycetes bacterium]|nr:hypothetical protein [Planctomycetota bacterium]
MKYIKKILVTAINIFRELKLSVKILLAVTAVVFFMGISIVATGQPGFCNSCHIMNRYYSSWEKSSHSEVECLECHLTPGVMGLIKGKINGLSQAIDCIVGRVGTKPNAVVEDVSCLRAPCHSTEKLVSAETDFRGIRFEHKKHIARNVDGVKISCTTCHSHFEGNEHFEVESETCFTCHFLKERIKDWFRPTV